MQIFRHVDKLPHGHATDTIQDGCLVLEGGAWRGIYTQGALDALMKAGINFQTVIGVSAGAISGLTYMSGNIGLSGRINLTYRHDPRYCGAGAFLSDHGITGFSYLFNTIFPKMGFDVDRFNDANRRFVVVATNCLTGEATYFERGKCQIFKAVQASATVPYVSKPVMIRGVPYLDGGISQKVPYDWALAQNFDHIVVIRTRDRDFRRDDKDPGAVSKLMYRQYPEILADMAATETSYNNMCDKLEADCRRGRSFALYPSEPIHMKRFEGDMNLLGHYYSLGFHDMKKALPALKSYLGN